MTYEINVKQIVDDAVKSSIKDYERISKDRLDFGFDSIYFRYAEVVEELSYYKAYEARKEGRDFDRKNFCNTRKMHFYGCLEQLLQCHQLEEGKKR